MPRDNDTDAEKGTDAPLRFSCILECPECGHEQDCLFEDGSIDVEQIVDAPEADQTCESCGAVWHAVYDGWVNYGDA